MSRDEIVPTYRIPPLVRAVSGSVGGAERTRTADPLLAKQALSQLSYRPGCFPIVGLRKAADARPPNRASTALPQRSLVSGRRVVGTRSIPPRPTSLLQIIPVDGSLATPILRETLRASSLSMVTGRTWQEDSATGQARVGDPTRASPPAALQICAPTSSTIPGARLDDFLVRDPGVPPTSHHLRPARVLTSKAFMPWPEHGTPRVPKCA